MTLNNVQSLTRLQNSANIISTLKNLPQNAGVYRYYDIANNLLYVGKAKNLKKRITSYFTNPKDKSERTILMVSQIDKIEYSTVETEKDALILESNLINSLQPKYNILLKGDNNYLYVRKTNDEIPSFQITRRKYDKNSKYFGPYTKKYAISDVLRSLRIIFPYCENKTIGTKPCHYVSLKQCNGVCCGLETIQDYKERLENIDKILNGKTKDVKQKIKEKMNSAVEIGNYELASLWRDKLFLLDETLSNQQIILPHPQDIDLLSLVVSKQIDGLYIGSFYLQSIREGKIVNVNNYILTGSEFFNPEGEFQDEQQNNTKTKLELENIQGMQITKSFLLRFFSGFNNQNAPINIQCFYEVE